VLRGLQRYDLVTLFTTLGTLTSALGTVAILLLGGGILGVVALSLPVTLVVQVALVRTLKRVAPDYRFGWHGAERRLVRTVLSYSSSVFLIQAAGQLQTKTDEIVIGVMLPVSAITPYALARKLSESAQIVTDQFMKILLPLASGLHATDDRIRLRVLYVISTRLTLAISLPIACALIFLAGPLLTLWVGPDYSAGTQLVGVLTIASVIVTSQWPAGNILQGMARHHTLAMMAFGNGVLNLALSIALAPRFGLMGIAFATLIPAAIENLGFVLPYALRSVQVRPLEAVLEIAIPTLLPALPTAFVVWKLSALVAAGGGLLAVLAVSATGTLIYAVGYLAFPATGMERQACLRGIIEMKRFIARRLRQA